jgi:hypothetical protein
MTGESKAPDVSSVRTLFEMMARRPSKQTLKCQEHCSPTKTSFDA